MGVIIKYRAAVVPVEPIAQGEEVEPPALDALPPNLFYKNSPEEALRVSFLLRLRLVSHPHVMK
jgi:hypothetical protein